MVVVGCWWLVVGGWWLVVVVVVVVAVVVVVVVVVAVAVVAVDAVDVVAVSLVIVIHFIIVVPIAWHQCCCPQDCGCLRHHCVGGGWCLLTVVVMRHGKFMLSQLSAPEVHRTMVCHCQHHL